MRKFTGLDGIGLQASVHGRPTDRPVLLLHGGGQTRHAWRDAAIKLAEQNFYAIALDARGHGDSEWASDGNYHFDAFAGDLLAVINTLPQRPALVGASLGGLTALLTLGENAATLASALVLVDIVPKLDLQGAQKITAFMSAHPDGFATLEQAADAIETYMPQRNRPRNLQGLSKNLRRRDDGRFYWHWDPKFLTRKPGMDPTTLFARISTAAEKIRIPTLLIRGELSEIVSDAGVEDFRKLMPAAEYVNLQGAGHMVAGDKNNAFNAAVIEFLRRQAA
jgi:non-heme chloroperoxidase